MNVPAFIAIKARFNSLKKRIHTMLRMPHIRNGVYYDYGEHEYHWYKNDLLHSEDDYPSLVDALILNRKQWHKNGKLHRDDDKPAYIFDRYTVWYNNGIVHREGGPAIKNLSSVSNLMYEERWFIHGKMHRFDGPAYVNSSIINVKSRWYIKDNLVDEEEYTDWLKFNDIDINNLTDDDKLLILLKWGIT